MDTLHIVSFSGGKDSTAMLLHMLETGMQVDEIIFCDTGVEFPQMYEHLDKVQKYIERPITRLKREHDYKYMLLEHEVKTRDGSHKKGYPVRTKSLRILRKEMQAEGLITLQGRVPRQRLLKRVGLA